MGFVGPKLQRNELPLDKWVKDMEEKEKPCLEVNDMTIRDHPQMTSIIAPDFLHTHPHVGSFFVLYLWDHSSITSSKRWVSKVRKWQFLMIYSTVNHQRGGWA